MLAYENKDKINNCKLIEYKYKHKMITFALSLKISRFLLHQIYIGINYFIKVSENDDDNRRLFTSDRFCSPICKIKRQTSADTDVTADTSRTHNRDRNRR